MASHIFSYIFPTYLILISTFFLTITAIFSEEFAKTEEMTSVNKMTHLHFYFHEQVSAKSPTAFIILKGKNDIGTTAVTDDPLTEGTEHGSKIVGRAQGMYTLTTKSDVALLMIMNFVFLEGKFNGSTISVLGHYPVFHKVREMPIVGGTGLFRFSGGYALSKPFSSKPNGGFVAEYDVYVMHSKI